MNSKIIGTAIAVLVAAAALAACGGGSGKPASSSTTPSPSASRSRGAGGGGFGALFTNPQAKACLSAAGIALPTDRPTNRPTGSGRATFPRRSGFPTGQRASGFPTGLRGSGFPARVGGTAGANSAELDKIRAALTACGITLPTAGPRPSGARPSATPTATG